MFKFLIAVLLSLNVLIVDAATFQVLDGTMTFNAGGGPFTITIDGGGSFTEGVFDGSASSCCSNVVDASATLSGLQSFQFRAADVVSYFAETGIGGGVRSAPTIDFSTMTADMSSFYISWNGNEFYQGNTASVSGLGGGVYELSWSSISDDVTNKAAPFDWTMRVSAVPVPASFWLFGSGLIGLIGLLKRKK